MRTLKNYKKKFEKAVEDYIESLGEKNKLIEAAEYVLTNGGKRIRPIIVMIIAESINKGLNVISSAMSVEFFHTASLIADDLPCMDNEKERRCKAALHVAFEESVALLTSYSFISAGYEMIAKNTEVLISEHQISKDVANELCVLALKEVSKVAGISGAIGGQFLDLFPPDTTKETIFKIIKNKTGVLFDISFILGWLFGGGEKEKLNEIKESSELFGLAFQIADDFADFDQDILNNNQINIVRALGKDKSVELFNKCLDDFQKKMDQLNILTDPFIFICDYLKKTALKDLKKL